MNVSSVILRFGLVLLAGGIPAPVRSAEPLATWHVRTAPIPSATENLEGVAYGNGRWVIVGDDGTLLNSPDGAQWIAETNPLGTVGFTDVTFGNGLFVAVGRGATALLTSPDGRQWTPRTSGFVGGSEIIHDGVRFVVARPAGGLSVSTNGADWSNPPGIPQKHVDVGGLAFGKGTYVSAGYQRSGGPPDLFSSTDFKQWSPRDSRVTENLMNAGYGLGLFYLVGMDGTLVTSPDGVEWTPRSVPHSGFIWDVAEGGGHVVAAAQWGRLLTSPDGIVWTRRETEFLWHFTDVAFGGNTFVAVGWDGQIVQSDPLPMQPGHSRLSQPVKSSPDDAFAFHIAGDVGRSYRIETSTDLRTWSPLETVVLVSSPMSYVDVDAGGSRRFYRVQAVP